MIQLKYFLGLVSMNLETFLGFYMCARLLCFKCGQFDVMHCIDSLVGRVLASRSRVRILRCAIIY